jgi:maltooligosyltrehalose trehalohydrolase
MIVGANYLGQNRCEFRVWAPLRQQVAVNILSADARLIPLTKEAGGYWSATVEAVSPGTLYEIQLEGDLYRPDPASQYQPQGVHGPSQVVDQQNYQWSDAGWSGKPLQDYIIYELHVGTFTPEGTFEAIIPQLSVLKELGITAIELMPVAQFPGDEPGGDVSAYRNWGYDGTYSFAVQNSYGGPEGLKQLVDACHQQGLAVIMDVVYNHFGPEGNYTADFGPYFTQRYNTPWGSGINFDDAYSDGVRQFVIDNASMWFRDYHIDALRLDAIHAIYDFGATHILADMKAAVSVLEQTRGYPCYLIAESDLNDVRVINPPERGGHGLDAQWSDDFHHALHTLLTGEDVGYYEDFGSPEQLVKALQKGFVYDGIYSRHRKRTHGSDASECPPYQLVVCAQNHDQVGNRMLGERLSTLVTFEALKLAAGAVLLSPYIPLLFMGEEYGETAPFLYFISHSDADLLTAVREGRKREFKAFHAFGDPPVADSLETFEQSKLHWDLRESGKHNLLWRYYQTLIKLRRNIPALAHLDQRHIEAKCTDGDGLVYWHRWFESSRVVCFMNFQPETIHYIPVLDGKWQQRLNSADVNWMGPGSQAPEYLETANPIVLPSQSLVLYERCDTT